MSGDKKNHRKRKQSTLHWTSSSSRDQEKSEDPNILTPVRHKEPVAHYTTRFEEPAHSRKNKITSDEQILEAPTMNAQPEDVASLDAIINAMYVLISGSKGGRDWDRIRSLHLPGSHLIPTGKRVNGEEGLRVLDIEGWIDGARPLFAENDFYEVEIARKVDRFGNIAQAFSTYECRWEEHGPAFMRGINSIQLLKKDGRWWIVSVFWDNEGEENHIPKQYLPQLA
jgi:hypothetical protein